MAYFAIDEDGTEKVFTTKPFRKTFPNFKIWSCDNLYNYSTLPKGSIEKLLDKKLTWKDEPVYLI